MTIIEIGLLLTAFTLCIYAAIVDIRNGIIKNKVLAIYALAALVFDIILYSIFAHSLLMRFLANSCILIVLSIFLFYAHIWAGGDCKLACVLALLYPAKMYFSYNGSYVTLFWVIALAFVLGYFYLVIDSIVSLCKKQWNLSVHQLAKSMFHFFTSYIRVAVYLTAIYLVFEFWFPVFYEIPSAIQISISVLLAWIFSTLEIFKKKVIFLGTLVCVILVSLLARYSPVEINLRQYSFVFTVSLIQIAISGHNYRVIPTYKVCQGMILSTVTTSLFTFSKIRGLPRISSEDLRSRLTQEEAECVKKWGCSSKGQANVIIVRKIPFAIFIGLGYILYCLIWSVL